MSRPPLLRIDGVRAYRYVDGKRREVVDVDASEVTDRRQLQASLDEFRLNGLPPDEAAHGAPEVDPESAGNIAIVLLGLALQECPPAMSPRVVEQSA